MNVEIGADAALFPEKEYINGIAVAVDATESIPCEKSIALWNWFLETKIPCEGIEDFRIVVVICCVWRKGTPFGQHITILWDMADSMQYLVPT